jgi:hypothetical protein
LLRGLLAAVTSEIRSGENYGMRFCVFADIYIVTLRHAAEHGEVEIDEWFAFRPKALVTFSGFNFHNSFNGGYFHAHFASDLIEIFFGETSGAHLWSDSEDNGVAVGSLRKYSRFGFTVRLFGVRFSLLRIVVRRGSHS